MRHAALQAAPMPWLQGNWSLQHYQQLRRGFNKFTARCQPLFGNASGMHLVVLYRPGYCILPRLIHQQRCPAHNEPTGSSYHEARLNQQFPAHAVGVECKPMATRALR